MVQIGVNPGDAARSGARVANLASEYHNLDVDFRGAIHAAEIAAVERRCASGYAPFGVDHSAAILAVMRHAGAVGGHTVAGGRRAGQTDDTAAGDFRASTSGLSDRMNGRHPGGGPLLPP